MIELTAEELCEAKRAGVLAYLIASVNGESDQHFWHHKRELADGRVLYLRPMLHGNLQLGVSPHGRAQWFDNLWCYHDVDAAWRAAFGWDGSGEPSGWYRHPQTGRRRPDGDPAREYVDL